MITISVCVGVFTLTPSGICAPRGARNPATGSACRPAPGRGNRRRPASASLETLRHAVHHVRHQCAHRARHRIRFAAFLSRLEFQRAVRSLPSPGCCSLPIVPSGPLTVICSSLKATSAPSQRDRAFYLLETFLLLSALSDVAEDFAADAGCARLAVGHHALGRRHDCHAQAIHDHRNVVSAPVHTQTRRERAQCARSPDGQRSTSSTMSSSDLHASVFTAKSSI